MIKDCKAEPFENSDLPVSAGKTDSSAANGLANGGKTPIYIEFTPAPTIRKWSHEPFEGAVRYDAAGALALDDDELADLISEAISDSLDVDWRPIDAARYVIRALEDAGIVKAIEQERDQ